LKAECDEALSTSAVSFNLRRYTVVRPGGLTEDDPRGVGAIELNQGDDKSGKIARGDVAAICVSAGSYTRPLLSSTLSRFGQ
jgi:hypothetical protein